MRRGRGNPIRVRRATIILRLVVGDAVSAIARLVAADEDTVRDVIHAFNERRLTALDPRWAGGHPRRINDADVAFIVETATTESTDPNKDAKLDRIEEPRPSSKPSSRASPSPGQTGSSPPSASPAPDTNPGRRPLYQRTRPRIRRLAH